MSALCQPSVAKMSSTGRQLLALQVPRVEVRPTCRAHVMMEPSRLRTVQGSGLSVIEKVRPLGFLSGSASGLGGVRGTAADAYGSDLQTVPRGRIFIRQMSSPILMLLSSSTSTSQPKACSKSTLLYPVVH